MFPEAKQIHDLKIFSSSLDAFTLDIKLNISDLHLRFRVLDVFEKQNGTYYVNVQRVFHLEHIQKPSS